MIDHDGVIELMNGLVSLGERGQWQAESHINDTYSFAGPGMFTVVFALNLRGEGRSSVKFVGGAAQMVPASAEVYRAVALAGKRYDWCGTWADEVAGSLSLGTTLTVPSDVLDVDSVHFGYLEGMVQAVGTSAGHLGDEIVGKFGGSLFGPDDAVKLILAYMS